MDTVGEKRKYRLADFFNAHWDTYSKNPTKPISEDQYRAVNAIRTCRTEVLGKEIYACPQCGDISEVYHSCKHRFCPNCSWKDTLKWAEKAYTKLLNIPHRHAVATLPHALNSLLEKNYRLLNNALFRASAETLKDWMQAKYQITPGIMSVLHTFGEKKNRHHHAHMIVSMGGINKKTGELVKVADKFMPFEFLSKKFRIKFENILVDLFDANELDTNFANRRELLIFLKTINKDNWRFHFEPPMVDAHKVIRYIGRYSKRACLSERKIQSIDGEYIGFEYKDYMDRDEQGVAKQKVMTLHYRDFFPLLLQHVPDKGFQIIRYYGLYSNANRIEERHTQKPTINEADAETIYQNPKKCAHCQCDKEHIFTIFDRRKRKERTERFDMKKHKHLIIPVKVA